MALLLSKYVGDAVHSYGTCTVQTLMRDAQRVSSELSDHGSQPPPSVGDIGSFYLLNSPFYGTIPRPWTTVLVPPGVVCVAEALQVHIRGLNNLLVWPASRTDPRGRSKLMKDSF
jgi:hypothetical protein